MPLTKRPNVVSNGFIDAVLYELDEYMNRTPEWQNFNIEITSAVRTPLSQLNVINAYATSKNIKFDEFSSLDVYGTTVIDGETYYRWQRTWSKLLNIGIIVNPPLDAICLFDYINASGQNRKGQVIHQSPHIAGKAFDISGQAGLDKIKRLIDGAIKEQVGIKSYTIERENNAFHCNII